MVRKQKKMRLTRLDIKIQIIIDSLRNLRGKLNNFNNRYFNRKPAKNYAYTKRIE